MSHAIYHAQSSARRFGGVPEDYIAIHEWFDASKAFIADARHRALRHHAQGIFWCEEVFGRSIKNSAGRDIPVRLIGEQHVVEDFRQIPTLTDWFGKLPLEEWMYKQAAVLPNILSDPDAALPELVAQDTDLMKQEVLRLQQELALINGILHDASLQRFMAEYYPSEAVRIETDWQGQKVRVRVSDAKNKALLPNAGADDQLTAQQTLLPVPAVYCTSGSVNPIPS